MAHYSLAGLKVTAVGRPKANRLVVVVPVAERVAPIDRRLALVVPTIDLSHYYRTPREQIDYFAALVAAMALRPAVVPRDPLVTATGQQHPRAVARPWTLVLPMLRAAAERALVPPRRRAAVEQDSARPMLRPVVVRPSLRAAAERPRH
jgi:hypothetical protein